MPLRSCLLSLTKIDYLLAGSFRLLLLACDSLPLRAYMACSGGGEVAAAPNKYEVSKRGEIAVKFEFLRNNLRRCAKLTSHSDAPKPEGHLGTLPQSTDQGETSNTRMAWRLVHHPDLEREWIKIQNLYQEPHWTHKN